MPTVKFGLIDGSNAERDRDGWVSKEALLIVDGLTHTLGDDDLAAEALSALDNAGYTYGSAHPDSSEYPNLKLLGPRRFTAVSSSRVEVACTYKRPDRDDPNYVAIRGDVSLVKEKTNQDVDGEDLVLEWTPEAGRDAKRQTGTVDIWLPVRTLEFSKRLAVNPAPIAADIVGKVNSDTFQDAAAEYWLCMGLSFESPDGGVHWDTTMRFGHNPKKWRQTAYFVLDNGTIPDNWDNAANAGKTVKEIEVYDSAAFGALGLPNAMS
jgi:hypothetical protein